MPFICAPFSLASQLSMVHVIVTILLLYPISYKQLLNFSPSAIRITSILEKMLVAGEASGSESCLTDNLRGAGGVEGEQMLPARIIEVDQIRSFRGYG